MKAVASRIEVAVGEVTVAAYRVSTDIPESDGTLDEAADLVLSLGGSLSGEHGDEQSRAELLPKMFGDDLVQAFREFKATWDPEGA